MSHQQSVIERIEIPIHMNRVEEIIDQKFIPQERILKMYTSETTEEIRSIITNYSTRIDVTKTIPYFPAVHELTESYHLEELFYTKRNRVIYFDQKLVVFPSYYIVHIPHSTIYHVCLEEFSRLIQMNAWVDIGTL